MNPHKSERVRYVMGTLLQAQAEASSFAAAEAALESGLERIQQFERLLSIYRRDSEIVQVNQAAGKAAVRVSADTFNAAAAAIDWAARLDGRMDPTIGPLVQLWQTARRVNQIPSSESIDQARAFVGFREVELDAATQTIRLQRPIMQLNFGSFGKGYALDAGLAAILQHEDVHSVTLNFGGQLMIWKHEFSKPEVVTIDVPTLENDPRLRVAMVQPASISTTSNAERPDHILDPYTGRAAREKTSMTIIAPTAAAADALSTAMFIEESWVALLSQFPGCYGLGVRPVGTGSYDVETSPGWPAATSN